MDESHRNAEEAVLQQVNLHLKELDHLYHRLILIVAPHASGKTAALARLATANGWQLVNVNLGLAKKLLDLPKRRRPTEAHRLLAELLDDTGDVVLLDNIELLFAPDIEQNPLAMFKGLSRNRTLIVSWPGCVRGTKLTYAEIGHPEAREFSIDGIVVIETRPPM